MTFAGVKQHNKNKARHAKHKKETQGKTNVLDERTNVCIECIYGLFVIYGFAFFLIKKCLISTVHIIRIAGMKNTRNRP